MRFFLFSCFLVNCYLLCFTSKVPVSYILYDSERGLLELDEDSFDKNFGPRTIAWAIYSNGINKTGWATLEVHTSGNYSDSMQAYYAGVVEGFGTRDLIAMHWKNTVGDYCKGQEDYCNRLKKFLNINYDSIIKTVENSRENSPYWHHVGLVIEQLAGLDDGFNNKSNTSPHMNVDVFGLNLMNIFGDVEDLEVILNKTTKLRRLLGSGSCSGLLKLLKDKSDLYVSQDTWNDYPSMLRVLKYYELNYHMNPKTDTSIIPGNRVTFSSYPGILQSGDDFYTISSNLVTLETTISNRNNDLYKSVKPNEIVLEWIRAITANRLANSGAEWATIFSRNNSGTYNNQWMIVDYKLFEPSRPLKKGLLTVLEQLPTYIKWADLTYLLSKQSYFPSYNTPYFKSIFNLSGGNEMVEKYGDLFSYDKNPRANIFRRDQSKVVDIDSMITLMRYNDYTKDPLSRCNCTPPYSAENAIAARSDLNPINGTYSFQFLGHRPHGATDMKLTSNDLRKDLRFFAVSGPTHDNVPIFKWSESDYNHLSHIGHPDVWNFPIIWTKFDTVSKGRV